MNPLCFLDPKGKMQCKCDCPDTGGSLPQHRRLREAHGDTTHLGMHDLPRGLLLIEHLTLKKWPQTLLCG